MTPFIVPAALESACRRDAGRARWLDQLPDVVHDLERRWSVRTGTPFEDEVSCAWVAPASRSDGSSVVLKVGMPHMEGLHEIAGLRFWNGDPVVQLFEGDEATGAMLLERCRPGTTLRLLPEPKQDLAIAGLLRRLWRTPPVGHPFRPLTGMTSHWAAETLADVDRWIDPGLVRAGLDLFERLPRTATTEVLLATDLHAGNVLRAEREPWLVIDPKPFVGDPAYDGTQHLFNCERTRSTPLDTIHRLADLLEIDRERLRLWTFARAAAEPRDDWDDPERASLARALG